MIKEAKNLGINNIRGTTFKKQGFTAVEVLIGASLMVTLIAGMLHLIKQGNYFVELARDQTRITQLLQSEIEDLRTLNWNDLTEMDGFAAFTPEGNFVNAFAGDYTCYRYVYEPSSFPNERWVWVIGYWTDSHNRTHQAYFFTTFSEGGLNDYYYRTV